MLQAVLDWHRATLLWKCAGLTGEQLAEQGVPPSGLSLLGLIRHLTKVERTWFRIRFAGEPVDDPFGGAEAEFENIDPARAAADYARLTEEFKLADTAVANASLEDTFDFRGEQMSLRLIYLHMIEEYARHIGHADLLREQIDGAIGELPLRGDGVVWIGAMRQCGVNTVVDPPELEALDEQVLAARIDRLHPRAFIEEQVSLVRAGVPLDLRPEHVDRLPVRSRVFSDHRRYRALVPALGGYIPALPTEDMTAVRRALRRRLRNRRLRNRWHPGRYRWRGGGSGRRCRPPGHARSSRRCGRWRR
ncbi:MAG: DinB family protein [Streptosporangiaceae bacterium]|nr:DinB family protein [Streptosporangiaceae bacterium]